MKINNIKSLGAFSASNSGGGGGGTTTIDTELSTTSTNPVQNKIITNALNNKLSLNGGTLTDWLTLAYDEEDQTMDSTVVMPGGIEVYSTAPYIFLNPTQEEPQPIEYAAISMLDGIEVAGVRDYTGTTGEDGYEYDNYRVMVSLNPQYGPTKLELLSDSNNAPQLYRTYRDNNNTYISENVAWLDTTGKLPSDSMTRVVELTTTSVELASDNIYNGAELANVTFTLPATVPTNFTTQVNFTSGATATVLTAPNTVYFDGDDCSNGVLTPVANKRYQVLIASDGVNLNGYVIAR